MKNKLVYITTVIISILFIFFGNKIAMNNSFSVSAKAGSDSQKAKVEKILERKSQSYDMGENQTQEGISIKFLAKIISGKNKGKTVTVLQNSGFGVAIPVEEVSVGDKLVIMKANTEDGNVEWMAGDYIRTDVLAVLAIVFFAFLLLFGHRKGFNTIISLVFTCLAVFMVFIPSVISGKNIYFWSILTSVFIITMSFLIVSGANRKSLAAGLGCLGGICVSAVLTGIMSPLLKLSGIVNEDSMFLLYVNENQPINLKAVIFAAILIGAIGAIMDVSMTISSSLLEIHRNSKTMLASSIYKSGLAIGRDIMGTMSNTLILAYIGSSLSIVLLLTKYNTSLLQLLNKEMVVVDILQALVGSLGVLFTIPFTALISAIFYSKEKKHSKIS